MTYYCPYCDEYGTPLFPDFLNITEQSMSLGAHLISKHEDKMKKRNVMQ